MLRNKRGRDSERSVHRDEEWPPLATTRESPSTETKTQHSQKKKKSYSLKKNTKKNQSHWEKAGSHLGTGLWAVASPRNLGRDFFGPPSPQRASGTYTRTCVQELYVAPPLVGPDSAPWSHSPRRLRSCRFCPDCIPLLRSLVLVPLTQDPNLQQQLGPSIDSGL